MNWFLISGAILSFLAVIFHGFVGGKIYKKNINKLSNNFISINELQEIFIRFLKN